MLLVYASLARGEPVTSSLLMGLSSFIGRRSKGEKVMDLDTISVGGDASLGAARCIAWRF